MTTKRNSVYGSGMKAVKKENPIVTESPTVEEITADLEAKGMPPEDLFEPEAAGEILDKLGNAEVVPDHNEQKVENDDSIKMVIPWWKPWKGSGRLIVQGFRRTKVLKGGIIMAPTDDKNKIPPDTKLYVVAIDPAIHGINVGDMVKFAVDFVPTGQYLDDVFYYIPHWQDVLIVDLKPEEMARIMGKREKNK